MYQLTPSLGALVASYAKCFRTEVFQTFCQMLRAWIVCLGRCTISRVWETTGLSQHHDHSAAFRLFSQAAWNWDEIGRLLIIQIPPQTHTKPLLGQGLATGRWRPIRPCVAAWRCCLCLVVV
jgi:hypothetical protein